jgi:hypothetical protein
MAKAKFTQDQLNEAMAEFFGDENLSIEWGMRPAVGLNGPITVYNKVEPNESNQAASQ